MLRQGVPARDTGKPAMPFKEQQLKQLRAQCLVFLAFRQTVLLLPFGFEKNDLNDIFDVKLCCSMCRNGLAPKKLHLEIALGTAFSREGDWFYIYFI